MNSDEVLDWIHFASTTSSAKWEHTSSYTLEWLVVPANVKDATVLSMQIFLTLKISCDQNLVDPESVFY